MLNIDTKRRIDTARDILVGKVPDPKAQVEQITTALIYKFMDDMDKESEELGGEASFFVNEYTKYSWSKMLDPRLTGFERLNLYAEALTKMPQNPHLPQLFRDIFKDAFLPYRDPETLNLFLKEINGFTYDHSENLGNSFEYLLSVMDSQGDAGQFRTPRHIIDFIVKVVDPKKEDTILDPACGTAGFLISSYKHILQQNGVKRAGDQLTPEDRTRLMRQFVGYDISPDMVRLSLVNLYLHGFPNPNIHEYDTLTSEERWDETYDVIMANPPFMSPKGGIRPHKRFSIQANRSEVLFVDYIAEHLTTHGRAGVIVPEGIIFQSGNAYKALRKMLVEKYLFAVVSLPAGIFQPYSGVKTSILLMDKQLAKKAESILFVKVENDGFDLGAQRRPIEKNDLTQALAILQQYKQALQSGEDPRTILSDSAVANMAVIAEKAQIAKNGDYNLSGERYKSITSFTNQKWPIVDIREVCEFKNGLWKGKNPPYEKVKILRNTNFTKDGRLNFDDVAELDVEIHQLETRLMEYGDIILEKSGGGPSQPVGRVALFTLTETDGRYSYSNFTSRIRVRDKRIEPIFLWIMLNNLYQKGATTFLQNQTSGIRNLDLSAYQELKIPLPPLVVQQEIVAELKSYQKIIDGAEQVVGNYKPLIDVPFDCDMVELGELCEHIQYGISEPMNTGGKGYKIFRMHELINGFLVDNGDMKYADISLSEFNKYKLNKDDILFNRTNSYEHVGRTGIFKLVGEYCFASYLIRLVINKALAIPDYINYFMNTDHFQTTIKLKATRAIGQANINAKSLAEYKIPLPPLDVQEQIVVQLEEEKRLVGANKRLVEIFEQKIQVKISEVWGDEQPSGTYETESNKTETKEVETKEIEIRQKTLFPT